MKLIVQEWPGWGDDDRDWVVVDEDGLPGDETNYYGLVACGFGTEEAALDFIANPPAKKAAPVQRVFDPDVDDPDDWI